MVKKGLSRTRRILAALSLAALGALTPSARAAMTLTPAGTSLGLTLSTFATGFPSFNNVGPIGITFGSGSVLVADYPGNVRLFPTDVDNQNAASIPVAQNYGVGNGVGLASVGANFYMARQNQGDVIQLNADGTFNQVIVTGLQFATGVSTDVPTGHIFVSTLDTNSIYDVDPVAKTKTLFTNATVDGILVNPTGTILYGAGGNGHVLGFNIATKTQIFDSGSIPGGIDGLVLGTGVLSGTLLVNTNSGTIVDLNLTTLSQTTLASGGSRGDFASADPNGTQLFTQSDSIVRLTTPASAVPLPSGLMAGIFTIGVLALISAAYRKTTATA